jgi:hypothetical protein
MMPRATKNHNKWRYVPSALAALCLVVSTSASVRAGLYCSEEKIAELPSQWTGFLIDLRALRNLASPAASAGRARYQQAARALEAGRASLTASEFADLGALYIRLGETSKALGLLREGERRYPANFHIAANLGTAWQMVGDLGQAAAALERAVRLAPPALKPAEELQLKLVRLRQNEAPGTQKLDRLFALTYENDRGEYLPGHLSAAARKVIPPEAIALVQQLALWLPADGRLLWQLAELAAAQGDIAIAAGIMDGCMNEFGLKDPELRRRRQQMRDAADKLVTRPAGYGMSADHEGHVSSFRPKSKRPLIVKLDETTLPRIQPNGTTPLVWSILAETTLDRHFQPTFPPYLHDLDGRTVSLEGYLQPIGDDVELNSFLLIENPVGCWYCEMPAITGMVQVNMTPPLAAHFTRKPIRVTGKFHLNTTGAEDFLYTISNAQMVSIHRPNAEEARQSSP